MAKHHLVDRFVYFRDKDSEGDWKDWAKPHQVLDVQLDSSGKYVFLLLNLTTGTIRQRKTASDCELRLVTPEQNPYR